VKGSFQKEQMLLKFCSQLTSLQRLEVHYVISLDGTEARNMADMKEISKWLVIIGGIVGLIEGVLTILGMGFAFVGLGGFIPGMGLVFGAIAIVLSLVALATSGVVDIKALKMENNWIILLILGILIFIFGSNLGGVLVLVGAILLLLK
jgi:hypothetical protein